MDAFGGKASSENVGSAGDCVSTTSGSVTKLVSLPATVSPVGSHNVQEQVLGYLEVQSSDLAGHVQEGGAVYNLQPQEIEIDGEHVILAGEEAGEFILVLSTDQDQTGEQTVAQLAQGGILSGTLLANTATGAQNLASCEQVLTRLEVVDGSILTSSVSGAVISEASATVTGGVVDVPKEVDVSTVSHTPIVKVGELMDIKESDHVTSEVICESELQVQDDGIPVVLHETCISTEEVDQGTRVAEPVGHGADAPEVIMDECVSEATINRFSSLHVSEQLLRQNRGKGDTSAKHGGNKQTSESGGGVTSTAMKNNNGHLHTHEVFVQSPMTTPVTSHGFNSRPIIVNLGLGRVNKKSSVTEVPTTVSLPLQVTHDGVAVSQPHIVPSTCSVQAEISASQGCPVSPEIVEVESGESNVYMATEPGSSIIVEPASNVSAEAMSMPQNESNIVTPTQNITLVDPDTPTLNMQSDAESVETLDQEAAAEHEQNAVHCLVSGIQTESPHRQLPGHSKSEVDTCEIDHSDEDFVMGSASDDSDTEGLRLLTHALDNPRIQDNENVINEEMIAFSKAVSSGNVIKKDETNMGEEEVEEVEVSQEEKATKEAETEQISDVEIIEIEEVESDSSQRIHKRPKRRGSSDGVKAGEASCAEGRKLEPIMIDDVEEEEVISLDEPDDGKENVKEKQTEVATDTYCIKEVIEFEEVHEVSEHEDSLQHVNVVIEEIDVCELTSTAGNERGDDVLSADADKGPSQGTEMTRTIEGNEDVEMTYFEESGKLLQTEGDMSEVGKEEDKPKEDSLDVLKDGGGGGADVKEVADITRNTQYNSTRSPEETTLGVVEDAKFDSSEIVSRNTEHSQTNNPQTIHETRAITSCEKDEASLSNILETHHRIPAECMNINPADIPLPEDTSLTRNIETDVPCAPEGMDDESVSTKEIDETTVDIHEQSSARDVHDAEMSAEENTASEAPPVGEALTEEAPSEDTDVPKNAGMEYTTPVDKFMTDAVSDSCSDEQVEVIEICNEKLVNPNKGTETACTTEGDSAVRLVQVDEEVASCSEGDDLTPKLQIIEDSSDKIDDTSNPAASCEQDCVLVSDCETIDKPKQNDITDSNETISVVVERQGDVSDFTIEQDNNKFNVLHGDEEALCDAVSAEEAYNQEICEEAITIEDGGSQILDVESVETDEFLADDAGNVKELYPTTESPLEEALNRDVDSDNLCGDKGGHSVSNVQASEEMEDAGVEGIQRMLCSVPETEELIPPEEPFEVETATQIQEHEIQEKPKDLHMSGETTVNYAESDATCGDQNLEDINSEQLISVDNGAEVINAEEIETDTKATEPENTNEVACNTDEIRQSDSEGDDKVSTNKIDDVQSNVDLGLVAGTNQDECEDTIEGLGTQLGGKEFEKRGDINHATDHNQKGSDKDPNSDKEGKGDSPNAVTEIQTEQENIEVQEEQLQVDPEVQFSKESPRTEGIKLSETTESIPEIIPDAEQGTEQMDAADAQESNMMDALSTGSEMCLQLSLTDDSDKDKVSEESLENRTKNTEVSKGSDGDNGVERIHEIDLPETVDLGATERSESAAQDTKASEHLVPKIQKAFRKLISSDKTIPLHMETEVNLSLIKSKISTKLTGDRQKLEEASEVLPENDAGDDRMNKVSGDGIALDSSALAEKPSVEIDERKAEVQRRLKEQEMSSAILDEQFENLRSSSGGPTSPPASGTPPVIENGAPEGEAPDPEHSQKSPRTGIKRPRRQKVAIIKSWPLRTRKRVESTPINPEDQNESHDGSKNDSELSPKVFDSPINTSNCTEPESPSLANLTQSHFMEESLSPEKESNASRNVGEESWSSLIHDKSTETDMPKAKRQRKSNKEQTNKVPQRKRQMMPQKRGKRVLLMSDINKRSEEMFESLLAETKKLKKSPLAEYYKGGSHEGKGVKRTYNKDPLRSVKRQKTGAGLEKRWEQGRFEGKGFISKGRHIRSHTEPNLSRASISFSKTDIKENDAERKATSFAEKQCDFRIRYQVSKTPSPVKVNTYVCSMCSFSTTRLDNAIRHYKDQCPFAISPDFFSWEKNFKEQMQKRYEERQKRAEQYNDERGSKLQYNDDRASKSQYNDDRPSKSLACTQTTGKSRKRHASAESRDHRGEGDAPSSEKQENEKSEKTQTPLTAEDDDFDDLGIGYLDSDDSEDMPSPFEIQNKNLFGFSEDDVVWAEWRNIHWPALVLKLYPKTKKASIMFIDNPSPKRGIRLHKRKIATFNNAELNKKFIGEARFTPHEDVFMKAVQKAEDFLRKRCLGSQVSARQFFEHFEELDLLSDDDSSSLAPSESGRALLDRPLGDAGSSRSATPSSFVDPDKPNDPGPEEPKEEVVATSETLARMKEKRKQQNAKLLRYIKEGKVETHLLGVYRGTIPSDRHTKFNSDSLAERKLLKHVSWFGPIDDEEQQEEIYDYCLQHFKVNCDYTENFDVVAYMFEVWVPEAIVKAISRVKRITMEEAEAVFAKGIELTELEQRELNKEFERAKMTEDETKGQQGMTSEKLKLTAVSNKVAELADV